MSEACCLRQPYFAISKVAEFRGIRLSTNDIIAFGDAAETAMKGAAPGLSAAVEPLVAEIQHYPPSMGEDDDELVSVRLGDLRRIKAALARVCGEVQP